MKKEESNKQEKPKYIAKYWLSKHKYIAELSTCIAVVTVDDNGKIIRAATFGHKGE